MTDWIYLNDEKLYKIYNNGTVYSVKSKKFINPCYKKKSNYLIIGLVINNKNTKNVLHTLIYKTFNTDYNKKNYVKHKDGDVYNNDLTNLQLIKRNNPKFTQQLLDDNEWKDIPKYENRYLINKNGDIKSLLTNTILYDKYNTQYEQSYKSIKLINSDCVRKSYLVHRLVYLTFVGIINDNMVIDHINQNKFDNTLNNLRQITQAQNCMNYTKNKKVIINQEIFTENFKNINKLYKDYDFSNYKINEYGQLKNQHNKILQPATNKLYKIVVLTDKTTKKRYNVRIHQLVATIFLPNPNNYLIVHHKDTNRENNHILNLEWVTHTQNINFSQAKKIGQFTLNDKLIKEFNSVNDVFKELNKEYGSNISKVCNGERKTAFGYKWKWIEE